MQKIITVLASFLAVAVSTVTASPGPRDITYAISLNGADYDATSNSTTFSYTVVSNPQGGPAISHWVLGLEGPCAGSGSLVSASEALVEWTNSDPTTGMAGIKFDTGYDDLDTRIVELTLDGEWGTGTVAIAVKAGNGFVTGLVQGPVCGATERPRTFTVSGLAFFDNNADAAFGADELGLGGFNVNLLTATSEVVATTTTSSDGTYSFTNVVPGWYYVVVSHDVDGLRSTTLTEHYLEVSVANAQAPDTGYTLDFSALSRMTANGFTIGYWKNNLSKAAAGVTRGVQVSATTLNQYTAAIRGFALEPFADVTLSSAAAIMSANSPAPESLLAKQLLASEYNFANGAYLNGSELLTSLFIYQGEYVLKHAASYPASYVLWMKDWFDAYNNSHGGLVLGPTL